MNFFNKIVNKIMINHKFQISNCKIALNEKNLVIRVDLGEYAKIYLYFILLPLIMVFFLFITFFLEDVIIGIIFLSLSYLIPASPFIVLYFYYKDKIIEWRFDKTAETIKEAKVSPSFKELKIISFKHVNYFYFQCEGFNDYSLKFAIRDINIVKIYEDGKNTCRELGIIISKFTEKPLYYKEGNWREKIYG